MRPVDPALVRLQGASRFVPANGIHLHVLEYGIGNDPTLVIVPGITAPAALWEFVGVELARDYHVLTVDNRGRGLSGRATGYALVDYARDVAELIEGLSLDRPFVLGHSMGARIVTAFGALHPGRCAGLVVADPPVTGPGRDPYPMSVETLLEAIRRARDGASPEDLRPIFPSSSDAQLVLRAKWLPTCDETAVSESYRLFHSEDLFDYWRRLVAPTLLVWGRQSDTVSEAAARELALENPAAEVACVEDAGHMLPWDNLPGFLAVVRSFVGGANRASRS
jgi:N-formylmaleamate deformylase